MLVAPCSTAKRPLRARCYATVSWRTLLTAVTTRNRMRSMGPCTHSARKLLRFVPCLAPAATALLMLRMWMSARRLPSVEAGDGAVRPSQQSRTSPEKLAEDPQCAAGDGGEAVGGGERYLLYQPQFGLSNQIVALRNAVVWALLLNRTLVLPHLLGHGTAQLMAAHSDAFDGTSAATAPNANIVWCEDLATTTIMYWGHF